MCCLQKPAGSVLYFSGNMLSGGQSSVSLQCSIYSQSLGAKGLYPDTHLLHFSVVKDRKNEVFPKKPLLWSIFVHDRDLKGKVFENVFCDPQSTDLTPSDSVHNWQWHLFPLPFFLITLQSKAAKRHCSELIHEIKKTIILVHEFASEMSPSEWFFFSFVILRNLLLQVGKFFQAPWISSPCYLFTQLNLLSVLSPQVILIYSIHSTLANL